MKFKRDVFAGKIAIWASFIETGFENIYHEFAYNKYNMSVKFFPIAYCLF